MRIFYAEAPMHNWKIWRIFGILLCSVSSALFEQSTKNVKPYIPLQLCSAPPQVISKKLNFSQENQFFKTASQIAAHLFHNSNKWWIFNLDKEDMILVSVISTFFKTMLWKKNQSVAFFLFWDKNRLKKVREAAQNALVIQLQNYPKNIRRKYLLRWIFFYINTNALTKIMLLSSFWNCAYWIKSAIFYPKIGPLMKT